jgi:hypothetical protein
MGEVRTYVHTGPDFTLDKWFEGLRKGHTFVSNGPVLEFSVDAQLPGSEIQKFPGGKVQIKGRVLSHPSIGLPESLLLVSNEGVVKQVVNAGRQTELSFEIEEPVSRSRWFVLSTLCRNKAIAHTSPVYVVVGGQRAWCPKRGPIIIEKQLKAIDEIAGEFSSDETPRGRGVLARLARARDYYRQLAGEMAAAL